MRVDIDKHGGGKWSLRVKETGPNGKVVLRTGLGARKEVTQKFRDLVEQLYAREGR